MWLWLELLSVNVVAFACNCRNQGVVRRLIEEALQILGRLRQNTALLIDANNKIPVTAALAVEPFDLRFFDYRRDLAVRGRISHVVDGVGILICDENLHVLLGV